MYDSTQLRYADGKTVFLTKDVKNKTSYSAYEGIANVPNATLEYTASVTTPKDNKTVVTVFQKDSATTPAATVIFVLNDQDVKMSSGNKDLLFVKGNTDGVSYTKDLGEFYEYTAYLNGEKITLRTDKNNRITAKSLVYGPQYDSKGILSGWEYADGINAAGNTAYTAGAYLVSADTVIHTVGTDAVSNGTIAAQTKKLKLSGLGELMDGIFLSEQLGYEKPNIEFFNQVFDALGPVDRSKVLIVGDSLTSDIRGGNNAGIPTCWYNPHGLSAGPAYQIDYEIKDLHEICPLLAL